MKLLFIKLKHIGDALLMTPTLMAARTQYPQAEIWVVVRKGTESILKGCPAIDRLLTSVAPEKHKRNFSDWKEEARLVRTLRAQHFDYAFELSDGDRGRFLTILSRARLKGLNNAYGKLKRVWQPFFKAVSNYPWQTQHSVEKDFHTVNEILPLAHPIPPLAFRKEATLAWEPAKSVDTFAILHPASRWQRNRWPVEKWIATGRWLLERIPTVIISAGPQVDEIALATEIQRALGPRAISTEGKLSWAQLAGLLYRAKLMVVGDTGALHLGAACQCPIVGLYRPSMVTHWSPWQTPHKTVSDPEYAPLGRKHPSENASSQTVAPTRVEDTIRACESILSQAHR